MEKPEYKNIFENEEKHFFYVSTHYLVLRLIEKHLKLPHPGPPLLKGKKILRILDAGCGTGGLMKKLSKLGKVTGIDFSPEAIKFAKKRGVSAKLGAMERIPFEKNQFDLVTCIDVIYHKHVKDDLKALKEIWRVLKPGGILVLRVPANKFLMSNHDKHVHTARRYGKQELKRKIKKSGLNIKQVTYVHSLIMLLSLAKVFFEKLFNPNKASSVEPVNPLVNLFFTTILNFETDLVVKGWSLPFGQGLIAVATK